MVRAESPDVKFSPAKVWLQDDKTLGGSQNFGFIQNLVSSNRGTVYRRGGDPAGDFVAELHDGHGKAWDAVSDRTTTPKSTRACSTPFYWPPSTITDDNVSGDPADDRSGRPRPARRSACPPSTRAGAVTEFKGEDKFKLGVGVKKGDAVHMLKAYDWSVPWGVQVGKDLNGAGKAIASSQVQDPLRDGPDTTPEELEPREGQRPGVGGLRDPRPRRKAQREPAARLAANRQGARPGLLPEHLLRAGLQGARRQGHDHVRHDARRTSATTSLSRQRPARRRADPQRGRHEHEQRRDPHDVARLGARRSGPRPTSRAARC